jgi:hypothetical protein
MQAGVQLYLRRRPSLCRRHSSNGGSQGHRRPRLNSPLRSRTTCTEYSENRIEMLEDIVA